MSAASKSQLVTFSSRIILMCNYSTYQLLTYHQCIYSAASPFISEAFYKNLLWKHLIYENKRLEISAVHLTASFRHMLVIYTQV